MDIKKDFLTVFADKQELFKIRLKYTRLFFILSCLVLFLSYLFSVSWFYSDISILILKYSYFVFSLSFFLLLIFSYIYYIGLKNKLYFFVFLFFMIIFYLISILWILIPKSLITNLI